MAKDKKSFLLYSDLLDKIEMLTIEERGVLFTHLLEYVNDKEPVLTDRLLLAAWKPIELELKRDLKKYEATKENKANGGRLGNLKRWNIDLYEDVINKNISLEEAEIIVISRKASHTDSNLSHTIASVAVNDNVNVNDNVSVNDINNNNTSSNKKSKIFTPPTQIEVENYFLENGYTKESGLKAFNYYASNNWKDGKGNQVKNWKQKMIGVWFKEENKISLPSKMTFEQIKEEQRKNMAF